MLRVKAWQRDVLKLVESLLTYFAAMLVVNLDKLLLLLLGSVFVIDRVAIFVKLLLIFVLGLADDLDAIVIVEGGIPLHAVPHAVCLIVHVVNSVAIDFSSSIDDLTRLYPLFVIFLLFDELLHVVQLAEVVNFKCVLRVNLLLIGQFDGFLQCLHEGRWGSHLILRASLDRDRQVAHKRLDGLVVLHL